MILSRRHPFLALAALAVACASTPKAPLDPHQRPAEIIDARTVAPDLLVDMAYLGSENFLGRPVAGYHANRCWLARPAAEALARVLAALKPRHLALRARDCYRPQKAVDDFVRWAKDPHDLARRSVHYPAFTDKEELFKQGYIAKKSGHSRAATIDLELVVATDFGWHEVSMGTPFDFLDPASNTETPLVSVAALRDRKVLVDAMAAEGFVNLAEEWWHYTYKPEPFPGVFFDFDVE